MTFLLSSSEWYFFVTEFDVLFGALSSFTSENNKMCSIYPYSFLDELFIFVSLSFVYVSKGWRFWLSKMATSWWPWCRDKSHRHYWVRLQLMFYVCCFTSEQLFQFSTHFHSSVADIWHQNTPKVGKLQRRPMSSPSEWYCWSWSLDVKQLI